MSRILVIDDDRESCEFLYEIFTSENWEVVWTQSPHNALQLFSSQKFDLVVSDINLESELSGIDLLRKFRSQNTDVRVVLISGFGTLETAVQAVNEGAFDFISKPFKVNTVLDTVRRALSKNTVEHTSAEASKLLKHYESSNLVGRSPKMIELYNEIARISNSNSTVLISGESGTGKELVAKSIHKHSRRHNKPFVTVNCGALTETLLESELFGHIKGSFTGAVSDKCGLFEEADQGTIFLDEIGETSLALQVKLLRTLQEGEIKRVGSSKSLQVNVRVVAATNRNLEALVKEGRFREDLFYRLSVFTLTIPPLRERREDIPLLCAHFLKRFADNSGKKLTISDEAMALISGYEWPGNVRELENTIEHSAIYSRTNQIMPEDLPFKVQNAHPARQIKFGRQPLTNLFEDLPSLDELERRYLLYVLDMTGGNRTRTAEILNIDRRTLYRMAQRFSVPLDEG